MFFVLVVRVESSGPASASIYRPKVFVCNAMMSRNLGGRRPQRFFVQLLRSLCSPPVSRVCSVLLDMKLLTFALANVTVFCFLGTSSLVTSHLLILHVYNQQKALRQCLGTTITRKPWKRALLQRWEP